MTGRRSFGCVMAMAFFCVSAMAEAQSPSAADFTTNFRTDRWTEDWRIKDAPAWKSIQLPGGVAHLSFGGDTHIRLEHKDPFAFGTTQEGARTNLIGRALLHADFRYASNVRTYVELGVWDQAGKPDGLFFDEADLALQRAFVDVVPDDHWTIRIGRQAVFDRSSRLLRAADALNYQQVFDGVHIDYRSDGSVTEAYIVEPFTSKNGYFKRFEGFGDGRWSGGSYRRTSRTIKGLSYGVYGVWIDRDVVAFLRVPGSEHRGVGVARMTFDAGSWRSSVEYGRQFGQVGGNPIKAWAFANELSVKLDNAGHWQASLRLDGASGDRAETVANESWAPAFGGTFNLGRNGVYGATNIIGAYPELSWQATPDLRFAIGGEHVWRVSDGAAFGGPGGDALLPAGATGDTFILNGANVGLKWRLSGTHELRANLFVLSPKGAFRQSGGEQLRGLTLNMISRF
jgi:hypothetical protein